MNWNNNSTQNDETQSETNASTVLRKERQTWKYRRTFRRTFLSAFNVYWLFVGHSCYFQVLYDSSSYYFRTLLLPTTFNFSVEEKWTCTVLIREKDTVLVLSLPGVLSLTFSGLHLLNHILVNSKRWESENRAQNEAPL